MRSIPSSILLGYLTLSGPSRASDWQDIDQDRDGHDASVDCDDSDPNTWPGNVEACDGADNNCDGVVDAYEADLDQDGVPACGGDCDDYDATVAPGVTECANDADDDCDGQIDEGTVYGDDDGDGYSEAMPGGSSGHLPAGDCDDEDSGVHPGAWDPSDPANGVDENCDGSIDGGALELDQDEDGQRPLDGDCNDLDPTVYLGAAELEDGRDSDCSGSDEALYGCNAARAGLGLTFGLLLWPRARRRRSVAALAGVIALGGGHQAWAQEPSGPDSGAPAVGARYDVGDAPSPAEVYYGGVAEARAASDQLMLSVLPRMDGRWADQVISQALMDERPVAYDGARAAQRQAKSTAGASSTDAERDQEDVDSELSKLDAEISRSTLRESELREGLQRQVLALDSLWADSPDLAWWEQTRSLALTAQWARAAERIQVSGPPWPLDVPPTLLLDLLRSCEDERSHRSTLDQRRGALLAADMVGPSSPPGPSANSAPSLTDLIHEQTTERANARVAEIDAELHVLDQPDDDTVAAARVRDLWDTLMVAALSDPLALPADAWAELFWRHGVAAMLAGNVDAGWRSLKQAVAVSGRVPKSPAIPVGVQTLLIAAEQQFRAAPLAMLRVTTTVDRAILVDGREVPATLGFIEQPLLPGLHLVVIQSPQDAAPLATVVRLGAGEVREVAWYPEVVRPDSPTVGGDTMDLGAPGATLEVPKVRREVTGDLEVGAQILMIADAALGGPTLSLRAGTERLGGYLGMAVLGAQHPILIDVDRSEQTFGSIRAGVSAETSWGWGGVGLTLGAEAVPLLSAGPDIGGTASVGGHRWNLVANTTVGYDLTRHEEGLPRLQIGAGLALRVSMVAVTRVATGERTP